MNEIKKEKYYKIFGIATLSIMFIAMCLYAAKQSFWLDELDWTIEFLAKSNIGDMIDQLLKTGYNLPLYYLIMFPIYKIVPYGELWLLFPNIIAAICGIYMTKKIGEKIGGKNLGFLSLCIAATSYVLIYKGVFELRPYAFLFCFSSIALYRYICRMENNNTKNNVLYTISIILLAYIHWFGCLLIAFYFLVDVFLWIRKKISISFIFPYVIVGIVFLPWFILMLTTHTTNFNEYWAGTPSISSLIFTFAFLLGYNIVCCILFAIAFISLIYLLIKKKKINKYFKYLEISIGSIIWMIGTIFIYSKFINPSGSLWVSRYFFCVLPQIFIITAIPLSEVFYKNIISNSKKIKIDVNNKKIDKYFSIIIPSLIIFIIACQSYLMLHLKCSSSGEPYREVSNIIANKTEIYQENSALLTSKGTGYLTYYFEKQGYNLPQNVFEGYTEENITQAVNKGTMIETTKIEKESLLNYDILYVFSVSKNFDENMLNFINENYNLVENNKKFKFSIYEKKNEN